MAFLTVGGKMCVARNYTEVLTEHLYNHTWLAPEVNLPISLEGISVESQQELLKVGMLSVGPFTVGWFPAVVILFVSSPQGITDF